MILSNKLNKGIKNIIIFLVPLFLITNNLNAIEQLTAHGGPVKGLAISKNNNIWQVPASIILLSFGN
jgi:hypothetical protein